MSRSAEGDWVLGEAEALPAQLLAYEYASQILGGVPMNQGETFRTWDLGVPSLYYCDHIDTTKEALEAGDYELIRQAWAQHRKRIPEAMEE